MLTARRRHRFCTKWGEGQRIQPVVVLLHALWRGGCGGRRRPVGLVATPHKLQRPNGQRTVRLPICCLGTGSSCGVGGCQCCRRRVHPVLRHPHGEGRLGRHRSCPWESAKRHAQQRTALPPRRRCLSLRSGWADRQLALGEAVGAVSSCRSSRGGASGGCSAVGGGATAAGDGYTTRAGRRTAVPAGAPLPRQRLAVRA